jgi:carbamate kinase
MPRAAPRIRTIIVGAAGRDFHNFNVVYRDDPAVEVVAFGAPQAALLREVSVDDIAALDLDPGSMGPKAEAAAEFAVSGGFAAIGRMEEALDLLAGRVGTAVAG